MANVLLIDTDPQITRFLLEILAQKGIHGIVTDSKEAIDNYLDKDEFDMVFACSQIEADVEYAKFPKVFELLKKIKLSQPEVPVIMIAEAKESNDQKAVLNTAVHAIKQGCHDFLIKPVDRRKIENILDTLLPNQDIQTCDTAEDGSQTLYRIVGRSEKLSQVVEIARKVAPTSAPVLISGDSGTGKELISYLIHHNSRRSSGPYIKVNCAALSESLLESELFGHEKGAFTGAHAQRKGRFEMAHGGTLLLDEITETSLRFQSKLLRVLEQQDFERVGGNDLIAVNVRILSTTNKNLLHEVEKGTFRKDLYYRLSGVRLLVPSLNQRTKDLPDLVWYFVNLFAKQANRKITKLDPAMMDLFARYHWPGNIRQLKNVVLTSMILGTGSTLSLADVSWLFDELQPLPQEENKLIENAGSDISGLGKIPMEQIERQAIIDTLRHTSGNQTKAAKVLGISDRTLRGKIKRYREQGVLQPA
jgi:DNA-binding NtrC family response regulator